MTDPTITVSTSNMEYDHIRYLGSNYNGLKNVEKIHVHKNLVASTKKA